MQYLAKGGLDGNRLGFSLEYMAANEHDLMLAEMRMSPSLFAAVCLGGMAQRYAEPFAILKNANLLLRAVQNHVPGTAPLEEEVGTILNAVLSMAQEDVRTEILSGLAMKVIFFYSCLLF